MGANTTATFTDYVMWSTGDDLTVVVFIRMPTRLFASCSIYGVGVPSVAPLV
jgi:hypothetical protein